MNKLITEVIQSLNYKPAASVHLKTFHHVGEDLTVFNLTQSLYLLKFY